ncbi:teichoic acid ABC transporter permease [Enterococcus sp. 10A9_DIV0425]|uniref:Transport permease protein n=1 Tax=Candidatus Enterococcus wittei TaxID=1987383 RepID=A0A242JW24_9ENTE|nr:ABC transporter permease [Enterococcus sp. 10A9_DIV0425]OTP09526.1 teichoic acid ABC transporter permease [Enterococcus sp. 10A9_DIV0425]THE15702.1 ABC transporter permease [Enterococcus hirae]
MFKDLYLFIKDIYQNRKLLLQFSLNDFKSRYAGSFLGILWAFINPVFTVLIYWLVFGFGLKAAMTDGKYPFIVYLITGMVPWFFFSDAFTSTTLVFREYTYLVKKVVFNIRILPTTKILSNLYTHLFFILIGLVVAIGHGIYPTVMSLQLFYYLFCMVAFLTGLTWLTASIQPFLPDIVQLITILLQLIMWTLPILWSPSQFNPAIVQILKLNPLYYIVQGYRESFLSQAWFWEHGMYTLYFWVFTLVIFVIGSVVFRRLKPHFSDVL